MEAFSKDAFESVEARIISSGEGKVMGVMGGAGGGVGVMESLGWLFLDQGDRTATGGEDLGEVTSVSV